MTEDDTPVGMKWDVIKNIYMDAATKILGYKRKNRNKLIMAGTWQTIEAKLRSTKSDVNQTGNQMEIRCKNGTIITTEREQAARSCLSA